MWLWHLSISSISCQGCKHNPVKMPLLFTWLLLSLSPQSTGITAEIFQTSFSVLAFNVAAPHRPCKTGKQISHIINKLNIYLRLHLIKLIKRCRTDPNFTPLMTDPIVHIPVMHICSSGQAYLVSVGSAMNVTLPPLHQALVSPLIQETESMTEKRARDTLRLLISGSTQLPSVLTNVDGKQNVVAAGSRGLFRGATDVNHAIANSIAGVGLVSLSERFKRPNNEKNTNCIMEIASTYFSKKILNLIIKD
ncbi:hypothetical protein CTI12_AA263200 [Artemisia annua]|uniref:Uncharacterized protein n=1 Tax=Artemisia annua TaxID=35608 RepID=A0A2U1MZX2_ARTAN|nr:hypothetical protein CTI12_AA263200 [Artemisia annua]